MTWVYWAITGAALVHIVEEYVYPGGFTDFMKHVNPKFTLGLDRAFVVIINGLFVLLCLFSAVLADEYPIFSLSVAGLLGVNGLIHLAAAFRARRYTPGMVSGILLYFPLCVMAYLYAIRTGRVTPGQAVQSALLGIIFNAIPIGYLALSRAGRSFHKKQHS